ncbi:MAG: aminoglycoside phosphotransferase family protein [Phenylobacterium sp.]|uniref:phosphotransferase family protein n=1 Tax=Phenylobacterium sp. TaxID=1871053 RepID=UPI0025E3BE2F|nr:aminoglycoside phosphotransferase family protein [Phenylobacterium sp.]MCA6247819.1 aminoglycoside phosphotransferase family protein [Phenylobacterium sp.]
MDAPFIDAEARVRSLGPEGRLLSAELLAGGVSSHIRKLVFQTARGIEAVVERRPKVMPGKPPPAERAALEAALLARLPELGIPAPRLRRFEAPDTLVLDFLEGGTDPPPGAPGSLIGPVAQALAALHWLGPEHGLPPLPTFTDPLADLRTWRPDLFPADAVPGPACPPLAGPPRLLHGDFWMGNLLWRDGGLAGLLDWEDACLGDPMAELAAARCDLHSRFGADAAEALAWAYAALAPVDRARLSWWDFYMPTAQLTHMDGWGLAPDDLARVRAAMTERRDQALAALGRR